MYRLEQVYACLCVCLLACVYVCVHVSGPALTTRQTRHLSRAPKQEGPYAEFYKLK